jgi:hypothetical protein
MDRAMSQPVNRGLQHQPLIDHLCCGKKTFH